MLCEREVGLVGDEAILAWRITEGDWKGTNLDGLSVVAVVKASSTLGDPFHSPYPAKAVLIFDQKATSEQRTALEAFARAEAGSLLDDVVSTEAVPIELEVGTGSNHGRVRLDAGLLASIETRPYNEGDHFCGNEFVYYPPLTELDHFMATYSLFDQYKGKGSALPGAGSGSAAPLWEPSHARTIGNPVSSISRTGSYGM